MKEGMSHFTDTYLTILGLLVFFFFFIGVLVWTSLKGNRENYKELEQLPLREGNLT